MICSIMSAVALLREIHGISNTAAIDGLPLAQHLQKLVQYNGAQLHGFRFAFHAYAIRSGADMRAGFGLQYFQIFVKYAEQPYLLVH